MSLAEIILGITTSAFAIAWLYGIQGNDHDRASAIGVYRVALAFLAAGRAGNAAPLFANAVLHGHPATIDRHFPDYPEFAAAELERMEQDDND
jgi:hypothetical protein